MSPSQPVSARDSEVARTAGFTAWRDSARERNALHVRLGISHRSNSERTESEAKHGCQLRPAGGCAVTCG